MTRAAVLAIASLLAHTTFSARASADDAPAPQTASGAAEASAEAAVERKGADLPDFDKVRTPDSPAFTLLEVSPTQIERPTTPKQLTAVFSKFVSDGNAVIPKNLAAEFSPFGLLAAVPKVRNYLDRGPGRQAFENFTISVATASSTRDVTDDMGVTTTHTDSSLGLGLRTNFKLSGKPAASCSEEELTQLIDIAKSEAVSSSPEGVALLRQTGQEIAAAAARHATPQELEALRQKLNTDALALKNKLVVDGDKIASLCIKEAGSVHRGWIMEVAGAVGARFPDDVAKDGRYQRASLWTDVAYEGDHLSLVFLVRGLDDKSSGAHAYLGDLGGRAILAKDAYAVSLEAIWRHAFDQPAMSPDDADTFRLALALDIHLWSSTWLTLAFGHDFASSNPGSLFSLANIKYGVGDPKVKLDTASAGPLTPAPP
ncbi:MAG TPA: hypothetical protein VLM79_22810 [Kofleriaceae bacterium]|nr:hypothetical protein [Kofleriaceae bacterium]